MEETEIHTLTFLVLTIPATPRGPVFDINLLPNNFLSHHDDLNFWAPEHMGLTPVVNPMRPNLLHPSPPTVENPHRVNNVLSLELWHSLPENDTR